MVQPIRKTSEGPTATFQLGWPKPYPTSLCLSTPAALVPHGAIYTPVLHQGEAKQGSEQNLMSLGRTSEMAKRKKRWQHEEKRWRQQEDFTQGMGQLSGDNGDQGKGRGKGCAKQ